MLPLPGVYTHRVIETLFSLFILSLAVASVSWTVTQEEIFSGFQAFCKGRCKTAGTAFERKFFYAFTCEYCFSHWVTIVVLVITGFRLLYNDWRGVGLAFFILPWLANQWMSIYRRVRVEIKYENALAEQVDDRLPPKTKK
jgi:hypothetical protein